MTLDPDTAAFLEQIGGLVAPAPRVDDEAGKAAFFAGLGAAGAGNMLEGEPEPVAHVEDRSIPGPDGEIPVRIYRPEGGQLPVVVFLHGGVFVLGDLDMHDPVLRRLANAIPAVIVSVDYRLAPAHAFPAAMSDSFAALSWAATHAEELGGNPDQLAVMGDSAGGALAAVSAIRARDEGGPELRLQVLVYPMIDPALTTRSAREFAEGYLTTTGFLELGWHVYLADHEGEPYTAPSAASDLRGVAPAIVITAEYDPLRDEGDDYVGRLREAGVEVVARHYPGQIHGFAFMPAVIPPANETLTELAALLGEALRPVTARTERATPIMRESSPR
jgi:acetyl esterase